MSATPASLSRRANWSTSGAACSGLAAGRKLGRGPWLVWAERLRFAQGLTRAQRAGRPAVAAAGLLVDQRTMVALRLAKSRDVELAVQVVVVAELLMQRLRRSGQERREQYLQ